MIIVYTIPIALLCTAWAVGIVLNLLFERMERGEQPSIQIETVPRETATIYGDVV